MRAHTTLRTAFRLGLMTAAVAGASLAATAAHADVADPEATEPAAPRVYSSTGSAALKYERNHGLDTTIDTGFYGPKQAQVRALVKIDPVKDRGPLYTIDMPKGAMIEASWGHDKKLVLKAVNGAVTDGTVTVRHSLTPSLELKIEGWGLSATFGFDTAMLLNKIPGSRFMYDSQASQSFAPWAFNPVDTRLGAPDMENAKLFSYDIEKFEFIKDANGTPRVVGNFGLRAQTKPTFTYQTKRVTILGAEGQLLSPSDQVTMDALDGDFVEVMAAVEGEMSVKGAIGIQPFVHLRRVLSTQLDLPLGIDVFSAKYETKDNDITFQSALVHIPLPNVHVPKVGVDLGDVKAGGKATKTIEIENSGEQEASMTFQTSNPEFAVPAGIISIPPKSTYELTVEFRPSSAGPAMADIKVASSDPDSPEQIFKIGANGADVGAPPSDDDGSGANADSGCACTTTGSSSTIPSWAGMGLLALGATVLVRRRARS